MKLAILFFATLKERAGRDRLTLELDQPTTIAALKQRLAQDFPTLSLSLPTALVSVNKEFAFPEDTLHDGDEVKLGDAVLVAHLTPGHTKGCTTWAMKVKDGDKTYNAVIVGSPNVNPGYKLVGNSLYPQIATDFERTFKVLKSLPADIFLGAHGSYFDMDAKYARMKAGAPMPFVDPDGYKKYVDEREKAFRNALARQQKTGDHR